MKALLDPRSISHSELKKFCEVNQIPLSSIIDRKDDCVLKNMSLKEAVEIFLQDCPCNTERKYRSIMHAIGDLDGLFSLDQSIESFLAKEAAIREVADKKWTNKWSDDDGEKGFIQSLYKFLKSGKVKKNEKKSSKSRRTQRLNPVAEPLTNPEYDKFIKQLRHNNKKYALIAEIIWCVNNIFFHDNEHITLESALRVTKNDVFLDCKMIDFSRMSGCLSKSFVSHKNK